jgi:hypothetical protein
MAKVKRPAAPKKDKPITGETALHAHPCTRCTGETRCYWTARGDCRLGDMFLCIRCVRGEMGWST